MRALPTLQSCQKLPWSTKKLKCWCGKHATKPKFTFDAMQKRC